MKGERPQTWAKKTSAKVLLFVLALGISMPLLFSNPRPAQAQFTDPITSVQTTLMNVWDTLKTQFVSGAIGSLVNGSNYFLSKLAYTLAVSLTSDCPGQVVCWNSKAFDEGLKQAWQGAIGELVETLSEEGGFSEIGLNLCSPDLDGSLNIQLGLLDEAMPPNDPNCTWNSFIDNWSAVGDQFSTGEVLDNFSAMFEPGQNNMSIGLGVIDYNTGNQLDKVREEGLNRLSTAAMGGFSDVTDPVSGRIKAPGSTVAEQYRLMQQNKERDGKETTEKMSAAELTRGAFVGPLMNMIQTFVQTFLSRLWNNFTQGLISSEEAIESQPDIILSAEGIFRPPGKTGARQALTRLLAPPQRDGGDVDIMAHFAVCPSVGRSAENCVMDEQFANVVRIGAATPFTVQGAIDEGYLHGDWSLISASDTRNQDQRCYASGYCESNLKKLRAHRIISIGWEIAAQQAIGSYANIRLQDVVDAFNDCNEDGERDRFHPFCHLIDPSWVLIAPAEQCRVQAYGAELVSSQIPQRAEICVDYESCLQRNDYGQCVGGWGYCVREKNVWRMNGDQCPAEYNTCRTLTPAGNGSPVSYLMNTVDYGVCNADNVGCAQYATTLNAVSCEINSECTCDSGCQIRTHLDFGETTGVSIYSCNPTTSFNSNCSVPTPCNDPDGCDIGCDIAQGSSDCTSLIGRESVDNDDWLMTPARYFDEQVESCDTRDNGCSTLIKLAGGNSLNLINNSSFENSDSANGLSNWLRPTAATAASYLVSDSDSALHGSRALRLKPGMAAVEIMSEPVRLRAGKMYTLSANFRTADGTGNINAIEALAFFDSAGNPVSPNISATAATFSEYIARYDLSLVGHDEPCEEVDVTADGIKDLKFSFQTEFSEIRAACSFYVTNEKVATAAMILRGGLAVAEELTVDAVQLEEGPLTRYHDGYSASATVSAKVAPSYLGCIGEASDPEECNSFAGMCRETEVGCERYTPTNGDPAVPGIVSSADICPAECSGYDMFFQAGTDFELSYEEKIAAGLPTTTDPADYFIPSTAEQCSAEDVGCSAFTNLDTEQVEYYSELRICQRPSEGDDTRTFYTWEGSDTTGYQLRAWQLKQTSVDMQPNRTVSDAFTADENLTVDLCGEAGCAAAGAAPCVKLQTDNTICDNTPVDRSAYCSQQDIEAGDFDCREFYDSAGNRHYRRLSQTIIAVENCNLYRISGQSSAEDCHKMNGRWYPDRNECVYSAAPDWSFACAATSAGCRSYRGNAASNVQTLFVEDFEYTNLNWRRGQHEAAIRAPISPESLVVGGHSVTVHGSGPNNHVWSYLDLGGNDDSLYTLSFWARGTSALNIFVGGLEHICILESGVCDTAEGCSCTDPYGQTCTISSGKSWCSSLPAGTIEGTPTFSVSNRAAATEDIPYLEVTSEWRKYDLGPVRINVTNPGAVVLSIHGLGVEGDGQIAYLDNVVLKRVQDNINVIRDSWQTPNSCDRTADGLYSPLEMLGCKEYRTSANALTYLKSFTALCRESSVGCQPYSNTYNTVKQTGDTTYQAVCNLGGVCGDGVVATGPNCPCDYSYPNVASAATGGAETVELTAVCRVPIGQSQCRFTLDGLDVSTDAPACTDNRQCESNLCEAGQCVPLLDYPVCSVGADCASGDCRAGQCVASAYSYNDRFTVPADERLYLVVDSTDQCAASAVGCKSLGQPTLQYERECRLTAGNPNVDANGSCTTPAGCLCTDRLTKETCTVETGKKSCVIGLDTPVVGKWSAVTLKDDPASYDKTLCSSDTVGCGKYTAADGTYYFKSPSSQICEFRTNVTYNDRKVSGWFRKSESGAVFPCYEGFLKDSAVYGIYRNKDVQYDGWVGLCSAEFDRCEEFIDPLDVSNSHPDGQPYYYIDNSKLDKKSCNGQVSLEQGCVPLLQTSSTQRLYSAAASYLRSQKETGGDLVNAMNCDLASPSPDCLNRCSYIAGGICLGAIGVGNSGSECTQNSDCTSSICSGETQWGMGCQLDSDCSVQQGEKCLPAPTELQHNDTNVILQVRRDRDCAEWLECAASMPVYDEQQGRWIERCSSLATCTGQVQIGESYACSDFKETPKEILTIDDYANRDITWNGLEYSGYSLVGTYPLEYLLPYKVTQGQCLSAGGEELKDRNGNIVRCRASSQCADLCVDGTARGCATTADTTVCTGPLGGICVSGANDGLSCATDAQCIDGTGLGFCSRSTLDTYRFGVQRSLCRDADHYGQACTMDSDCNNVVGSCATVCTQDEVPSSSNDGCPADGYEPTCTGAGCTESWGTCLQSVCVYDFHGGPLRDTKWNNAPSCRAYPETDSPFSYRVLETSSDKQNPKLKEAGATPGYNQFGVPAQQKLAYTGAHVCYEGNTCECSYTKVGYGTSGSVVRYHSADVTRKHRTAPDEGDGGKKQDFLGGVAAGICQGGPFDGQSCVPGGPADQCGAAESGGGSCAVLNSYSLAVGWVGFCTDYDYSTRLNADPATPGCNLWLPLDMMPGMTDSYSTSLSAGFQSPQDQLMYCSEAQGNAASGGICMNATDESGAFKIRACTSNEDCLSEDLEYNGPICTELTNVIEACNDTDEDYWTETAACSSLGSRAAACGNFDCVLAICRDHVGTPEMCDSIADLHDDCGSNVTCDNPEWLARTCDTEDNSYDARPCNPYLKPLHLNEGVTDHTSEDNRHYGFEETFNSEKWFQTYQSNDCNGDANKNTDTVPQPDVFENDVAEIIIDINGGDGKPIRISLNDGNKWEFAHHFDEDLPTDVSESDDNIKYLNNERTFPNSCISFFYGNGEGWADEGAACSDDNAADESQYSGNPGPFGTHNCIAARVLWDSDTGEYQGVETWVFTDRVEDSGAEIGRAFHLPLLGAYMRVREICTEVDLVHDTAENPPSVALTNRIFLMKGGAEIEDIPSLAGMENSYVWPSYVPTLQEINLDHTPFGAITSATPANLGSLDMGFGIPVVGNALTTSGSTAELSAGSPYYSYVEVIEGTGDAADKADYPEVHPSLGFAIVAGYPFSCRDTCLVPDAMVAATPMDGTGDSRINELFSVVYESYSINGSRTGYTRDAGGISDRRIAMMTIAGDEHEAPQVRPAMVFAGLCQEDGTVCPEFVGDGVSVNGVQGDLCFGGGVENNVQITYYVKADSDHMPIRRQIVDFGDGSQPLRLEGSFKNHRGLDSAGKYICGSADNDFGLSSDACDPHYMQFNKTYVCSENTVNNLPTCNAANPVYPCTRGGCCVYKPRVQVLDNWGVCNGTCTTDVDGEGDLCYNSSPVGYLAESYNATDWDNECTILNSGDRSYANDARQPYTAYDSEVIVCPGNCP
ncbi:MAG: hypothetical protein V1738_06165 [Patescibacteria group bacterium]